MVRNIGFIGTGLMGRGMARNLILKGHRLTVYNRTRSKVDELAGMGAIVADSPADAARTAGVIVTMVADPSALLSIMEGPQGVLSSIRPETTLIDSSTVSPATTFRVLESLRAHGATMVDAPVFGSKNEAEGGRLGFIVGAERAVFDSIVDVLECMGKPLYVGTNGMGIHAKLVVNLIIGGTLQAMNEGLMLATKAGIDPDTMVEVIQSSRAQSGIIAMKAPQILKRDFSTLFPLRLMDKDMGLVMDAFHELKIPAPVSALVKEIYSACMADGLAEEDYSATIKFLERLTKTEVVSRNAPPDPQNG